MGYPQQHPPQGYPAVPAPQYPPQQYPPQGYAQPQPPAAPPAAPPQQFANMGQQIAAANPLGDPFAAASVAERQVWVGPTDAAGNPIPNPTLRAMGVGRTVIIVPKQIKRNQPNPFAKTDPTRKPTRDELTCDLIVCDGPAFMYGGDPMKSINDFIGPMQVPCVIPDMFITQDGIIERVPEDRIGRGIVVAKLEKGTSAKGNKPWNANEVAPAAYEALGLRAIYQAYTAGQLPRPTVGVPREPQPGQPAPVHQTNTGGAYVVQQMPPAPQYPPQGAPYAAAPQAPGGQFQPVPQAAPAQPVSAPQAPAQDWTTGYPAPQGYEAMWGGMLPAQREQILLAMGVQSPEGAFARGAGGMPPAMAAQAPGSPYAQPPGY